MSKYLNVSIPKLLEPLLFYRQFNMYISKMWMIFLELFLEMLNNKLDVSLKGCKVGWKVTKRLI